MSSEIFGARDTNVVASGIRKIDVRDEILRYDPDASPLTVIISRLDSKPTENPEFWWYEKDRPTRRATCSTTGTGGTLTMSDGGLFAEHDIWRNTVTGENVRVTQVVGTTVSVVRGASPVSVTSGDEFLRVGTAQQEGDTSKPGRSYNPTKKLNYTQIHRTPYSATRTLMQSGRIVRGSEWADLAADGWLEHMIDQEASALWGVPRETLTGEHPRRETGGAYNFITTNVTDMGGTMTEAEFFGAYGDAFRYGSQAKFAFAGTGPIEVVNGYARGKLEVVQGDDDDTYGVSIMKYKSPSGTLNFVRHRLMDDSTVYDKHVLILDLLGSGNEKAVPRKRYLSGGEYGSSDTHIREHIEENDRDGRKDEILTEAGWEWGLERTHGLFTNITG